jgi:hypothetical protein
MPPPAGALFVIIIILIIVVVVIGKVLLDGAAALGARNARARERRVKHSSAGAHPVMSRSLKNYTPDPRVDNAVDAPLTAGQSGIAVNEWLTVDGDDGEDERDITEGTSAEKDLQYRLNLQALAKLVNAGAIGQAEGIEKLFDVTRSGRKDSRYAQIRADLLPLLKKDEAATPIAGRPTAAQFASDREAA